MSLRRFSVGVSCLAVLVVSLLVPLAAGPVAAPTQTRLLRQPTVSANHDRVRLRQQHLDRVERAGGMARRVDELSGHDDQPEVLARRRVDRVQRRIQRQRGRLRRPAEGGEPRRLTWHPGGDSVQGWTPDGKSVLFTSSRATLGAVSGARALLPRAGRRRRRGADGVSARLSGQDLADGTRIAYRMNSSWDEERRNYRGGQNRPDLDRRSEDVRPRVAAVDRLEGRRSGLGRRQVYFISDRDGVANVWAFETGSKRLRQVTKFTDFDVKAVDAGARRASCSSRAATSTSSSRGRAVQRSCNITATGDFPWMMPRWEDVSSRGLQHRDLADRQARGRRGARRDLHDPDRQR